MNEIDKIVLYFNVLEKYVSDLLPEAFELYKNIDEIWKSYLAYINYIKEQIEVYQNQFKLSMNMEVEKLKVNALEMLKMLEYTMPIDDEMESEQAFNIIENLMTKLEELESEENKIAEKMRLLGVEYKMMNEIQEIRKKLEDIKAIWIFSEGWTAFKVKFLDQQYTAIDLDYLSENMMILMKSFNDLKSSINKTEYPIYISTEMEVTNFDTIVKIIVQLKSSQMRERHWTSISVFLKISSLHEDVLTLIDMVDNKFDQYEDYFQHICHVARKEYEIETEIDLIANGANKIKINVKETNGVFTIANTTESYKLLQHYIMKVDQLNLSKYRNPFQKLINYWEEILNYEKDLLDSVIKTEQKCNVLHDLLKPADKSIDLQDILTTYRYSYKRWTHLMNFIRYSNLRLDICTKGLQLLLEVEDLCDNFERILDALRVMLEKERNNCFRFYLVPDIEMIDLLAHPTDLKQLKKALTYCFENIGNVITKRVAMPQKVDRWELSGILTYDDENIMFIDPITIDYAYTAGQTVNQLESYLRLALIKNVKICLHKLKLNYFNRISSGWLYNFPRQVCFKCSHIENTLLIRNALLQTELLEKSKPLKMLKIMHKKLLDGLVTDFTAAPESSSMSKKKTLYDYILTETNIRDVIGNLLATKVKGLKNFEWLSLLRAVWNEEKSTCAILHLNSSFHYGFECKYYCEPVTFAAHTNRMILTLTSAIKNMYVPCLYDSHDLCLGIIQQLSYELAVFMLVINGHQNLRIASIQQFLIGLTKMKSWVCFSAYQKIPDEIRVKINASVRNMIAARDKLKIIDLKNIKEETSFQIFVLSSDKKSIDLDRTILRTIGLDSPDHLIATQNCLFSLGIQDFRRMAHVIHKFINRISLQLPDQKHQWSISNIRKIISTCLCDSPIPETSSEYAIIGSLIVNEFTPSLPKHTIDIFTDTVSTYFSIEGDTIECVGIDPRINESMNLLNLTITETFVSKVQQIMSILSMHLPLVLIGGVGSGKSNLLKIALDVLSNGGDRSIRPYFLYFEQSSKHLPLNKDRVDNMITRLLKSKKHIRKCLIFDGTLPNTLLEHFTTDNEYISSDLSKISYDSVSLNIVFEICDLSECDPASLNKTKIVYVDEGCVEWKQVVSSWLSASTLHENIKNQFVEFCDQYLEQFVRFRTQNSDNMLINTDINIIRTFIILFEKLCIEYQEENRQYSENVPIPVIRKMFVFAGIWSIGALMNEKERERFDIYVREQLADSDSCFPLKGTIFQYYIESNGISSDWVIWKSYHIDKKLDDSCEFVFHLENIPCYYFVKHFVDLNLPILLTSDKSNVKSAMLKHILERNGDEHTICSTIISRNTQSQDLQNILKASSYNIAKEILYPKNRKSMTWLIEDLHNTLDQQTDTVEFLRHFTEHKFWYEHDMLYNLKKTNVSTTMKNLHSLNNNKLNSSRLLNKFTAINLIPYDQETMASIFSVIINAQQNNLLRILAPSTVDLILGLSVQFPSSPNKPRYQFSIKTVARILHGFLLSSAKTNISDKSSLLRLWIYECYRETYDLLERNDYKKFYEIFNNVVSTNYEATLHGVCPGNKSPIFTNVLSEKSLNEDVKDVNLLRAHACAALEKYNSNLMPHASSLEQATKIMRMIRIGKRPMIMVGEIGSGRKSICDLAIMMLNHSQDKLALITSHSDNISKISEQKTSEMITTKEKSSDENNTESKLSEGKTQSALSENRSQNGSENQLIETKASNIIIENCRRYFLFHLDICSEDTIEVLNAKFKELFSQCLIGYTVCFIYMDVSEKMNRNAMELMDHIIVKDTFLGLYDFNTSTPSISKNEWFLIRNNLQFICCAPKQNDLYRLFANNYPALVGFATVNCIHSLNEESLFEISKTFMTQHIVFDIPILSEKDPSKKRKRESLVQSTEDRLNQSTSEAISRMHSTGVSEIENSYPNNAVLDCWYFELLQVFKTSLETRRSILITMYRKYYTGIQKIIEAAQNVITLQEDLSAQKEQIIEFQNEIQAFIMDIEIQTEQADEKSKEVAIKREKIGEEEIVCKQLAAIAEADLSKAMPALNAAIAALDSLNKKDMNEIKSYARPPVKVELVLNAIMILLGKEPTWAEAKRQLGEQKFLDTLRNFDKNNITDKVLKIIGGYVRNPDLEPNKVGIVSKAAKSLILWVRAIENYGKVYRFVGPKIKKMEDAQASLLEKQAILRAAEKELADLAQRLALLRSEYAAKIQCKKELEEKVRLMEIKLERAQQLVEGLSSERSRWTNTADSLSKEYSFVIGDSLLAGACSVYLGSLSLHQREELISSWKLDLEAHEIPFSETFKLINFFHTTEDVQHWNNFGIPLDNLTLENAAILLNNKIRLPIIIDLQGEIQQWLCQMHDSSKIKIFDFNDTIPEKYIVTALEANKATLINEIQAQNVHNLFAIEKLYFKVATKISKKSNINFFLLSNESIVYKNWMKKSFKIINFVFGKDELEDKLLGVVVENENPSLEERRRLIVQTIIENRKTLAELEKNILEILNESKVPLIENDELYNVLQYSKQTEELMNTGLANAEEAKTDIETSREMYRSVASNASLIFFVIDSLKLFNTQYSFSLDWYLRVFDNSLTKSMKSQIIHERQHKINDFHTYNIFKNLILALKPADAQIYAFILCTKQLYEQDKISIREFKFLINGAGKIDRLEQVENPNTTWITSVHWDNITELDKLPGFRGIALSFVEDNMEWNEWYISTTPELEKLPVNWERNLTPFQKCMVVRCLRLDRFQPCLKNLIESNLGKRYAEFCWPSVLDVLNISIANIPILFISPQQWNPLLEIKRAAKAYSENTVPTVEYYNISGTSLESIGQHIKHCVQEEKWLYIDDIHKSHEFLLQLNQAFQYMESLNSKSSFRLMLKTIDKACIPSKILKYCSKFMYTEPTGVKYHMNGIYEQFGEKQFQKITKHQMIYRKLFFNLSYLQAILLERNKFQQWGWLEQQHFSFLDFQLIEKNIPYIIDELILPNQGLKSKLRGAVDQSSETSFAIKLWKFMQNIVSSVGYGGSINNQWDERILNTHFRELFKPESIIQVQNTVVLSKDVHPMPRDGNYKSYVNFIMNQLPHSDAASVFGQNENANIKYLESQSNYMLEKLQGVHLETKIDVSRDSSEYDIEYSTENSCRAVVGTSC
ncbi:dynein axonemal heavy chain 2-like isoform X2 [Uranotaenia lowii]|uniref:dynein axonemal heavy chain 2-like isoform X2 n=1 Tax=Uranotaenia lowii TaxID=190385 RepID=UPI0024786E91|nr:dynein axonemal heavy chain 2-like isoform X2 [Uranotaenia lowii]